MVPFQTGIGFEIQGRTWQEQYQLGIIDETTGRLESSQKFVVVMQRDWQR